MRYSVLLLCLVIATPGYAQVPGTHPTDSMAQVAPPDSALQAMPDSALKAYVLRLAAARYFRQLYLEKGVDIEFYVPRSTNQVLQVSWVAAGDAFVYQFLKVWRKDLKDLGFTWIQIMANLGDRTVYWWEGAL